MIAQIIREGPIFHENRTARPALRPGLTRHGTPRITTPSRHRTTSKTTLDLRPAAYPAGPGDTHGPSLSWLAMAGFPTGDG
jgi:hypothetical protein